tara:strand:+ start:203 stop:1108 length:906 start_codon:yes stop_codon:yes gene_type:complete
MQLQIHNQYDNEIHKLILKVCHKIELPLHFNQLGPRTFTNNQRVALLLLRERWNMSFQRFIDHLSETKWVRWLGLRDIPGKSTLHDWAKMFGMDKIRTFFSQLLTKEKPSMMALDGTGLDSYHRSRHYEWRIHAERTPHVKLDILIDVETMLVHDFCTRIRPRHDIIFAKSACRRIKQKGVLVLADGAYDCEPLHRLLNDKGNELYAPVRKSSRTNPKGWFRRKCVEKHPKYNQRSKVESTFSVIKKRFGPLKAKSHFMKKREMALRMIIYNMERMIKIGKVIIQIIKDLFRTWPNTTKYI